MDIGPVGVLLALCAGPAVAGAAVHDGASETAPAPAGPRIRFRDASLARVVDRAAQGAARRLAGAECRRIFEDFSDGEGVRLTERLAAAGQTAEGYFGLLHLFEGRHALVRCQNAGTLAVTQVGSRVVFLCPAFIEAQLREPAVAESALIHELLHSLSLGEDPPTPSQIQDRVYARCGR